jgi:serine/threonine protein kinase
MPVSPGSKLGPYEILAAPGAGGMGEVYRARDPRLGREVAIKILPAGSAGDSERMRRFEQEARATAALSIRIFSPCSTLAARTIPPTSSPNYSKEKPYERA